GAGVLRQVVAAGKTVEVGTVVGRLLEASEREHEVLATPAAKRLARELGVDLAALGASGRIREADVQAWHDAAAGGSGGRSAPTPAPPPQRGEGILAYDGRRRAIGERMTLSQ